VLNEWCRHKADDLSILEVDTLPEEAPLEEVADHGGDCCKLRR
jgi:hypothetical protein